MTNDVDRTTRIRRQHLQTDRFFGMDFVPVRMNIAAPRAAGNVEPTHVMGTHQEPSQPDSPYAAASTASGNDAAEAKTAALAELREKHDAECPHCTTAEGHTQTVFGEGHPDAALIFIGEAPGEQEDRTGRPFVGRAGQKLDEMIQAMKLQRDQVYIANVLKSRPPNNRTPLQHEVDGCSPYLVQQIRIIQPKVIVTLGGPATKLMLNTDQGISRLRGQWAEYTDSECGLHIPIMPTFHPAYLLRNYTKDTRQKVWADLQATMQVLGIA